MYLISIFICVPIHLAVVFDKVQSCHTIIPLINSSKTPVLRYIVKISDDTQFVDASNNLWYLHLHKRNISQQCNTQHHPLYSQLRLPLHLLLCYSGSLCQRFSSVEQGHQVLHVCRNIDIACNFCCLMFKTFLLSQYCMFFQPPSHPCLVDCLFGEEVVSKF
jgi:hypothetical protein